MFCPNCGHENNNENKFCIGCGKDIRQEAEAFKKDKQDDTPEDKAYKTEADTPSRAEEVKSIETEPGVCPECGYHNSPSSIKCVRCDFELKPSEAYDNRTYESTSNAQYNDQCINSQAIDNSPNVPQNKKDEPDYSMFSSDYRSEYKYKMLVPSLACSIGGAILVILACFLPYLTISDNSYSVINLSAVVGTIIIAYMAITIIFSMLKYQKATLGILIAMVVFLFSEFMDFISLKNQYVNVNINFNIGFYLIIAGCVAMVVGLFFSYKDYWDKTTRIMRRIVWAITVVIVVGLQLILPKDNYSGLYSENSAGVNNSMADVIIPGIHNGMSSKEVFAVVGENYDYYDNAPGIVAYYYDVDSVPALNCNIPAVMYFWFNEQDKLYAFSYDIGCNVDTYFNGSNRLNYNKDELIKVYDKIYDFMKTEYNVSWTDITNNSNYLITTGTIKAYSGSLNGSDDEILFTVGAYDNMNAISISFQNEAFSSSD
ncbi:zinc-ribbon domain-containing protein [Porcipelethomonas sp.]|uniref:zinc-ribbon domain-containing protein n=1 Tax=Porcipelethomonas sp. TaxID=2981675 RepID=UPI0030795FE5